MAPKSRTEVLDLLAEGNLRCSDAEVREFTFAALETLAVMSAGAEPAVRRGLLDILLRTIETRILADTTLVNLAHFYSAFSGRADETIRKRLSELAEIEPSVQTVHYLRECIRVHSRSRSTSVPDSIRLDHFADILRSRRAVGGVELRCDICGYHFRKEDMGGDRLQLALEEGAVLASVRHPQRLEDPFKPVATTGDRSRSLTDLTLDHLVPRSGFGSTTADNLAVLCQYCNHGKQIYRRALEPMSPVVAGALMAFPDTRNHWPTKQLTVTAALRSNGGHCIACNATRSGSELSVRQKASTDRSEQWFVPWNLDVLCYSCIGSR